MATYEARQMPPGRSRFPWPLFRFKQGSKRPLSNSLLILTSFLAVQKDLVLEQFQRDENICGYLLIELGSYVRTLD